MTPATVETEFLGEPLTPAERLVAGVPIVFGAVGHALFAGTVVLFFYILLTTVV